MNKLDSALVLAGIFQKDREQAHEPTNLHVITGDIVDKSEEGGVLIDIGGMVFSEDDSQFIRVDTLGGLEPGDVATILLTGENGKAMTPLAIGGVGTIDRIVVRVDSIEANYVKTTYLEAHYATIENLDAATARIGDLEADHVSVSDFSAEQANIDNLQAATADIATIRANSAKVANLTAAEVEADHATIGSLDASYAQVDLANVDNAWIENGTVKDGAITNAMINSVSANKLTAGTIDASNINVTNLNADNLTTGTINGQRIGEGSLSLSKLEDDVYTESEVDGKLATMQAEIDGAIETWTGTEVPTLNNTPASGWTTADERDRHVGDVYFVVNSQSQQNGYNYRFTKTGSTYSWQLIKDNDVTNALQRLTDAEGHITQFTSDISQLQTDTGTLTTKTESLETSLGDKVDVTTFNSLEDTVDGHTQTLSQHTTAISNKADNSTVTAVTNRVSKNEQDISGLTTSVGQLQTTVATKADGSTVQTIANNLSTLEQDVDGFKTTVSETYATKSETKMTNEAEGDVISVDDAMAAPAIELEVRGKSEQASYTGKNLIDPNRTPKGYYDTEGTFHSSNLYVWWSVSVTEGDVVRWANCTNNRCTTYLDGTFVASYSDQRNSGAIAIPAGVDEIRGYARTQSATTTAIVTKNNADLTYEPYTGGKPSPSPDYPQEIASVVNPVVTFAGQQLWTDITAGYVDASGNVVAQGSRLEYVTDFIPVTNGDVLYIRNNMPTDEQPWIGIGVYDSSKTFVKRYGYNAKERDVTIAEDEAAYVMVSTRTYGYTDSIFVTKNEDPTTVTLPVTLRSLPDGTKDELALTYLRPSTREGWSWYAGEVTRMVAYHEVPTDDGGWSIDSRDYFQHSRGTVPTYLAWVAPKRCNAQVRAKVSSDGSRVYLVRDDVDLEDFIAAMGGNPLVLLTLATPTTETLDPIELPILPAPNVTIWATADATPGLYVKYWTSAAEEIETRVLSAESRITQNAQNIELKVSKDGVISSINQSAETVKIQASKVEITGEAVFNAINNDTGTTTIAGGKIDADTVHVKAANIDGTLTASQINTSGLTIGQSQVTGLTTALDGKADTSDIPTNVSDLTNDSGFQTSSQVESAITSKGYQTSSQVDTAITSKGYATTTQAQGYADTAEANAKAAIPTDVSDLTNDAGYITDSDIPANNNLYGTCSTAAGTTNKTVVCPNVGSTVPVGTTLTFTSSTASTVTAPKIVIANSDNETVLEALPIWVNNAVAASGNPVLWTTKATLTLVLQDTYWELTTKPSAFAGTSNTAAATAAKVTNRPGAVILEGTVVSVTFATANTSTATTLNVGSTGAAQIRFNNAAISATNPLNWETNTTLTFVRTNQYWYVADNGAVSLAEDAAKTATSYVTDITGGGIMVHPSGDQTTGVQVTSDVDILRDGSSVINIGTNDAVRVGTSSGYHVGIDSDSLDMVDSSHTITTFVSDVTSVDDGTSAGSKTTTEIIVEPNPDYDRETSSSEVSRGAGYLRADSTSLTSKSDASVKTYENDVQLVASSNSVNQDTGFCFETAIMLINSGTDGAFTVDSKIAMSADDLQLSTIGGHGGTGTSHTFSMSDVIKMLTTEEVSLTRGSGASSWTAGQLKRSSKTVVVTIQDFKLASALASGSNSGTIATIPTGYRPDAVQRVPAALSVSGNYANIWAAIGTSGAIVLANHSGLSIPTTATISINCCYIID